MRRFVAVLLVVLAAVLCSPVPAAASGLRVSLTAVQATPTSPPTLTGVVERFVSGAWVPIGGTPQVLVNVFGRPTDHPTGPFAVYETVVATPGTGVFSWAPSFTRSTEFWALTSLAGSSITSSGSVVLAPDTATPAPGVTSDLRMSVTAVPATVSTPPQLTGLVEYEQDGVWLPAPSATLRVNARPAADPTADWSGYAQFDTEPDGTFVWDGSGWSPELLDFQLHSRRDGFVAWSEPVTLELVG